MPNQYDKKLFRFLFILNKLERAGQVTVSELADEFSVNVRTVQRDLANLSEAGFPTYSHEKGKYKFVGGFSLKKMMLSEEESSLLVMLKELSEGLGGGFDKAFDALSSKILPGQPSFYSVKIPKPQKIDQSSAFMKPLQKAIRKQIGVKLYYLKQDQIKFHTGDPLKFVFMEGQWYLAFRRSDGHIIKFRMDNISSVDLLDYHFDVDPKTQKIIDNMNSPWFGSDETNRAKLHVAKEAAEHFKRRVYFPVQKIDKTNKDGSIVLTSEYSRLMEVVPTILAWIPHIRVLEPVSLADEINQRIKNYISF